MDILQAMKERHSVRRYTDKPIEPEKIEEIEKAIASINEETGMNIQLVTNEPEAFTGTMASYGHFLGCSNYIVIVSENGRSEEIGYFGEELVLLCQMLGLNTCWVALTFSKGKTKYTCNKGEKLQIVISVGYGVHNGREHKNKPLSELCTVNGEAPDWFCNAMEAVLLAPTAMNQQKFHFTLINDKQVKAKALFGPYAKMDLGIAKYHFELGAGGHEFEWI